MAKINLAVLVKVDKKEVLAAAQAKTLDALREKIFYEVRGFIAKQEQNNFLNFVPSNYAWGQKIYERYGVVFGVTEPALFGYFHVSSLFFQNEQIEKKIASEGARIFDNNSAESGIISVLLDGDSLMKNPWVATLMSGGFLYDGGLYSIPHLKAGLDAADCEYLKRHHEDYAICVLDVYGQE